MSTNGLDTRLVRFSYEFIKQAKELIDEFAHLACMRHNDELGSSLFEMCGEDAVFRVFEKMFPLAIKYYREEVEIITLEEAEQRKLAKN